MSDRLPPTRSASPSHEDTTDWQEKREMRREAVNEAIAMVED